MAGMIAPSLRLMVSHTNVAQYDDENPCYLSSVMFDREKGRFAGVERCNALTATYKRSNGFAGLARRGERLLVLTQKDSKLLILDRSLEVQREISLKLVSDPHSLVVSAGKVLVNSTGTDSIISYDFKTREEKVFWELPQTHRGVREDGVRDTSHVNSIAMVHGEMVVSGFGLPQALEEGRSRWALCNDGFVMRTGANQELVRGLKHPHSLLWTQGKLYFCESRTFSVWCEGRVLLKPEHRRYCRGLEIVDDLLFVGVSGVRKKSKSTGRKVTAPVGMERKAAEDPGDASEGAVIQAFRLQGEECVLLDEYAYQGGPVEIYDIRSFQGLTA